MTDPGPVTTVAELLLLLVKEGKRRILVLSAIFSVIALGALAVGVLVPKEYEAHAILLADSRNMIAPLMAGRAVQTGSEDAHVVRQAFLSHRVLRELLVFGGWGEQKDPIEELRMMNRLARRITIQSARRELIRVSYRDTDPQRCFNVANKLAEIYIRESSVGNERESRGAFEFIDKQVKEYAAQAEEAHAKVLAYQRGQELQGGAPGNARRAQGSSRSPPRMSPEELAALTVEEAALAAELASSDARQSRQRRAERTIQLERELETLLTSFTENHPSVMRAREELRIQRLEAERAAPTEDAAMLSVRRRLEQVRRRIAAAADAAQRAHPIPTEPQDASPELRGVGQDSRLSELVRRYEATRQVYQDLLVRRENARVSMELEAGHGGISVRIYEPPELPVIATGLRLMHVAMLGLVLAVLTPVGLLFALLRLDPRVRSARENRARCRRAAPRRHPARTDPARPAAAATAHAARRRDGRCRVRHVRGLLHRQGEARVMSETGSDGKDAPEGRPPQGGADPAGHANGDHSEAAASDANPVRALAAQDLPFRTETSTAIRTATPGAPVWMATSEQFESFRELRTRLLDLASGVGREHFTTMIVPMTAKCGGSFVARNLAAAFTLQHRPSLLIECDFRSEAPDDGFGPGRDTEGLFDFLSEGDNPSAVLPIWPTVIRGLNVIPPGRRDLAFPGLQREHLSSPAMKELMARVRSWPCHAFLVAPPVEGSPDARILSELADLIVLVIGYRRATPRAIAHAAAMFDRKKFAGAVFNE